MSHPSSFGFTRRQLKMIEVIVMLNAMALSILLPTAQSTGEIPSPELCLNPPKTNPNQCHIYTWNNFPLDHQAVPSTGMFSNDSSYVFALNITGITQFQICTNVISGGSGNATFTLQYQSTAPGTPWLNVDTSGGQQGSVIITLSQGSGNPVCSNNPSGSNIMGNFNQSLINDNCISPNKFCNFRIGGNQGICTSGCIPLTSDQVVFSNIVIQFWFNGVHNQGVITCTATTVLTTSATNKCATTTAPSVTQTINVLWEADNRSGVGAGCGASDTCVRKGISSCSLVANTNVCTSTDTYGQTFTGTVRVSETWNLIQTLTSPSPGYAVTVIS